MMATILMPKWRTDLLMAQLEKNCQKRRHSGESVINMPVWGAEVRKRPGIHFTSCTSRTTPRWVWFTEKQDKSKENTHTFDWGGMHSHYLQFRITCLQMTSKNPCGFSPLSAAHWLANMSYNTNNTGGATESYRSNYKHRTQEQPNTSQNLQFHVRSPPGGWDDSTCCLLTAHCLHIHLSLTREADNHMLHICSQKLMQMHRETKKHSLAHMCALFVSRGVMRTLLQAVWNQKRKIISAQLIGSTSTQPAAQCGFVTTNQIEERWNFLREKAINHYQSLWIHLYYLMNYIKAFSAKGKTQWNTVHSKWQIRLLLCIWFFTWAHY